MSVSKITSPVTPLEEVAKINEIIDDKQDTLVSGTNIKTVNGSSLLGSGDIIIGGSVNIDNQTITKNSNDELQAVALIDQHSGFSPKKIWTGTREQYDAIVTKSSLTLYNITDDTDVSLTILEALYPVGSVYITTANTCPLSVLISGSTWTLVSSGIVKSGDIPCKGNGKSLGLTDGANNAGLGVISANAVAARRPLFNVNVGTTTTATTTLNALAAIGVTTDSSKSGIIADTSSLTLAVNIYERTA